MKLFELEAALKRKSKSIAAPSPLKLLNNVIAPSDTIPPFYMTQMIAYQKLPQHCQDRLGRFVFESFEDEIESQNSDPEFDAQTSE